MQAVIGFDAILTGMKRSLLPSWYLPALIGLLMLVSAINVADKELLAPIADAVRSELEMHDTPPL